MTDYLTEQEQIELLKGWIKQYSLVILMGVVIAAVSITGWRYYQQHQNKTLNHASAVFDEMLTMRSQNNRDTTLVQANKLTDHYPKTTYGQMGAFMIARDAVLKKDFAGAQKNLDWVIDHSSVKAMRQIARIRLARVLIANNQADQAINKLDKIDDKTFIGMINEVRGDAYLAMKQTDKARDAYQQALSQIPDAEVVRPLLQMKYDNLANTSPTTT